VLPLVTTALMLLACCSFGVALGWWLRHWSTAFAATVAVFTAVLVSYISENEILARTGGATEDITGLVLAPEWVLRQVGWFVAFSLACVAVAAIRPRRAGPGSVAAVAALILGVAAVGYVTASGSVDMFNSSRVELSCVGDPQICVTDPYLSKVSGIQSEIDEVMVVWSQLAVAEPQVFSQLAGSGDRSVFAVALPGSVLRGERSFDAQLVLNGYEEWLRPGCYDERIAVDSDLFELEYSLRSWLMFVGGAGGEAEEPWAEMDGDAQLQWAQAALAEVGAACSQP
jgi:hypothetical protein